MTKDEIKKSLEQGDFTLTDVIDAVIEVNGIIGVGRITLAEEVAEYIKLSSPKPKKHWTEYLND